MRLFSSILYITRSARSPSRRIFEPLSPILRFAGPQVFVHSQLFARCSRRGPFYGDCLAFPDGRPVVLQRHLTVLTINARWAPAVDLFEWYSGRGEAVAVERNALAFGIDALELGEFGRTDLIHHC